MLLALTAGMLGAVNPCGFALLPAYLSVLVAGEDKGAIGRALRCTAALTTGYVAVFGAFGLLLAPLAGWLQPRLPWLTVLLGLVLAGLGGRLLAGRSLPAIGMRAPEVTRSLASMTLFGMAYALASLGCAAGPFLAIVVATLRQGSVGSGFALFLAYAGGMGLIVGVVALAVALLKVSALARLRRASVFMPRIGGAVLLVTGGYVAYYGTYELRLVKNLGTSGHDPVVELASQVQHRLSDAVGRVGAGALMAILLILVLAGILRSRRIRAVGTDGR